jgi:hypothetical protein
VSAAGGAWSEASSNLDIEEELDEPIRHVP